MIPVLVIFFSLFTTSALASPTATPTDTPTATPTPPIIYRLDQNGFLVNKKLKVTMTPGLCSRSYIDGKSIVLDQCGGGGGSSLTLLDENGLDVTRDNLRFGYSLDTDQCVAGQTCVEVDEDALSCVKIADAGGMCLSQSNDLSGTLNLTTGSITQSSDPFTSGWVFSVRFTWDSSAKRYFHLTDGTTAAAAATVEHYYPECEKVGFISATTSATVTGDITIGLTNDEADSATLLTLESTDGDYDDGGESDGDWAAGEKASGWIDCDNTGACSGTVNVAITIWCM